MRELFAEPTMFIPGWLIAVSMLCSIRGMTRDRKTAIYGTIQNQAIIDIRTCGKMGRRRSN